MAGSTASIRIEGRTVAVPALEAEGRTVVVLGRWLKTAGVHDEAWLEGDALRDPEAVVARLQQGPVRADVLTFAQKPPDVTPKFNYRIEWDNVAAIPLTTYADWWEKRLPQESRKHVRKAAKLGVEVRIAPLDDTLVRGITEIYNEVPVRQGRPFSKYGMDFDAVKAEAGLIAARSDFICAYHQGTLIGFIKLVSMGRVAGILSIVSRVSHADKKPTNALIAKAVEVSCARGMTLLLYGKYVYGNKAGSTMTEFKRRNGFEKLLVPRYYVPLTLKGRLYLRCNLQRGLIGLLPGRLVEWLLGWRARYFNRRHAPAG